MRSRAVFLFLFFARTLDAKLFQNASMESSFPVANNAHFIVDPITEDSVFSDD